RYPSLRDAFTWNMNEKKTYAFSENPLPTVEIA
nr:transcription factor SNF5 homolog BAF-47 - rat (fragments) [Rattus norvegicus]